MALQSRSAFRRSGQRDDRRRRLLTDDLSNSSDWPACHVWSDDAPLPQRSEHYGDGEFLARQPRLLDLVPRRMIYLILLLLAASAAIAGLEAAYAWMLNRVANGGAAVMALDLAGKGSLGCWFSSLLLLAASVAALLVYSVRRHRTDDYQGRYRIWVWAAVCCLCAAADQAASLRDAFRDLMIGLTGTPLLGEGEMWWVVAYTLALGAIGSRLLIDMRSSRLSVGVVLAAAIAHTLTVAGRLGWILPDGGSQAVMFLTGSEMAGNLLLLSAITLYARHVILDAEGLLPRSEPVADDSIEEPETADPAEYSTSTGGRWTKVDPPHAAPQPYQRPATAPAPTAVAIQSPINRKLTKGERKALKERLLRERLERERRGL
jgi:hypothetical protein